MMALLADSFAQWKRADLLSALEKAGVPSGPINTIPEALSDPQIEHRRMLVDIPHCAAGTVRQVASPLRFSETPVFHDRGPPGLGEHTEQVLEEIGFDSARIEALRRGGII